MEKIIDTFIEEVSKVLNSNSIFLSIDYTGKPEDIIPYIEEYIKSGEFLLEEDEELEVEEGIPSTISNLELKLMPIDLVEFKAILLDMMLVKGAYFSYSPYSVEQDSEYAQLLVDCVILELTKTKDAKGFTFYNTPRHYIESTEEELAFLYDKKTRNYRPMSNRNTQNYLGSYFCHLGLDSFLIFHSDTKIYFLLTNGGD